MTKRVNVRVSDAIFEKTAVWAERLAVTKSQLMGMAIQAGLDSIIRAISPVESITSDQWADLVKAYEKKNEKEGEK